MTNYKDKVLGISRQLDLYSGYKAPIIEADLSSEELVLICELALARWQTIHETVTGPFVLSCVGCDAGDGIDSKKQALKAGWTGIQPDPGGLSWTWLGECPECKG